MQTHQLTPAATNTDVMEGKFKNGTAAMIIDGPWAVQGFRTAGVNFGVAALPKLPNGKSSAPSGAGLLREQVLEERQGVVDLIRYLSIHLPMPLYNASARVPVLKSAANNKRVRANPVTKVVIQATNNGEPMPNIPAMGVVWEPMGDQPALLVQGRPPRLRPHVPRRSASHARSRRRAVVPLDISGGRGETRPPFSRGERGERLLRGDRAAGTAAEHGPPDGVRLRLHRAGLLLPRVRDADRRRLHGLHLVHQRGRARALRPEHLGERRLRNYREVLFDLEFSTFLQVFQWTFPRCSAWSASPSAWCWRCS